MLLINLSGCDEVSTTSDSGSVEFESLSISPNTIQFDIDSPPGIQTIPVSLTLILSEPSESEFRYTVERQGILSTEGTFDHQSNTEYTAELSLSVNTADNHNLTVYAFAEEGSGGERIQGTINIRGRTVSPPVVEDAFNTEEVTIPDAGNERIDFFARVVHPDNQDFIDQVTFFMIDQQGNSIGGINVPDFDLHDNGVFNESEGLIDEAAGDSLYSRAFFIDPSNNPDVYSVYYYAIGIDGQSSDTLQTQLRIVD